MEYYNLLQLFELSCYPEYVPVDGCLCPSFMLGSHTQPQANRLTFIPFALVLSRASLTEVNCGLSEFFLFDSNCDSRYACQKTVDTMMIQDNVLLLLLYTHNCDVHILWPPKNFLLPLSRINLCRITDEFDRETLRQPHVTKF